MTAEPERALPAVTDLTRPFWEAANAGRLAIQRCQACGYYNHPPKPLCDRCQSGDLRFEDVSGEGVVWSFTVMHQRSIAGFQDVVPYVTALVELVEQKHLLLVTNLPGIEARDVEVGMPVRVTFQRLTDEIALPQFANREASRTSQPQGIASSVLSSRLS
jgi:uncharacterized OB-fold protein